MRFLFPIAGITFDFHNMHVVTRDLRVHFVNPHGRSPLETEN